MKIKMDKPIDFVICWVDGNDQNWIKEKEKYSPQVNNDNRLIRYRDWNILHYWFRGVEKFAPWVNKIHFVTWGHVPKWLDVNHPKINIIKHEDYIPKNFLPTFSSRPIEINFHRIKNLSEQFVFFNDDMFLLDYVKKSDFFKEGKPCDIGAMDIAIYKDEIHSSAALNSIMIINKYFSKRKFIKNNFLKAFNFKYGKNLTRTLLLLPWVNFTGYYNPHLPTSFLKSTYKEIWEKEPELLTSVSKNRFRTKEDVTQYLFRAWQLASGNYKPRKNLGKMFDLNHNLNSIINSIVKQRFKTICLNDNDDIKNFENTQQEITKSFDKILGKKSSYEK